MTTQAIVTDPLRPADGRPILPVCLGVALIVLGTAVVAGWWLQIQALVRLAPGFVPMTGATAISFVLCGAGLILASRGARYARALTATGAALATIAALVLLGHAVEFETGIDWPSLHSWLPAAGSYPGRMSAATAISFMLAATVLVLAPRVATARNATLVKGLVVALGGIGALGVAGYLVNAQVLFPEYLFAGMALHTAGGFVAFAAGMVSAWKCFEWGRSAMFARDDDRITFQGAAILAAIALTAGIASFAILQGRVETLVGDNIVAALTRRTELFQDLVELREMNARIAATRPAVIRNLRLIRMGADDGSNLANVQAVVAGFVSQGYGGVSYLDTRGNVVASGGNFVREPALVAQLATPAGAQLIWGEGFALRHRIVMRDSSGEVGTVLTEQPLAVLTRLSSRVLGMGETGDMGLCFASDSRLHCFPQRLNPRAFTAALLGPAGERLPMTRALQGESGIVTTQDYRGKDVVAAFGPVGDIGLGMVVKIDAAEIFQPIREQLQIVMVLLVFLVGAGTALLRSRIKPLATRLVDAEIAARGKHGELARANAAKDRFLASMSHELRTPLNAIIGFTGTLLMQLPGPLNAGQEKQLKTVQAGGRHLLSLINDLLDLAKVEAGKVELILEPSACQAVVDEVAASQRPLAESKGLAFVVEMPAEDLVVRTDRRALSQILINLTSNAIKFTEHGSVRILLGARELAGGRVVEIAVEDTGIGIHPEDGQKLFAAFAQLEAGRHKEGSGLGLHLSQKLAELLGGSIGFTSEPGRGSTFTLTIAAA